MFFALAPITANSHMKSPLVRVFDLPEVLIKVRPQHTGGVRGRRDWEGHLRHAVLVHHLHLPALCVCACALSLEGMEIIIREELLIGIEFWSLLPGETSRRKVRALPGPWPFLESQNDKAQQSCQQLSGVSKEVESTWRQKGTYPPL